MIKHVWAFITRRKLVWLKDLDGTVTLSIARTDPWGEMFADRYWPWRIRIVQLLPDGKVDGAYVVLWKYA